jgi:Outer membrane protein beta-barrel domain
MKSLLLRALAVAIVGSSMAVAQNSDLGLLLGVSVRPSASTISPGRIESSVSASLQLNYAIQLHEAHAGLLYLELPLMIADNHNSVIAGSISSSSNDTFFFTPGVRWHYTIHPRVAIYGSVGGGIAALNGSSSFIGNGIISSSNRTTVTGAFGFGGGIDFRLTRLLSLRAEGRDFVTRAGLGGESGHNHAFFTVGVGFHF